MANWKVKKAVVVMVHLANANVVNDAKAGGICSDLYNGRYTDLAIECAAGNGGAKETLLAHAAVLFPVAKRLRDSCYRRDNPEGPWATSLLSSCPRASVDVLLEFLYTGEAVFKAREGGFEELLFMLAKVGFERWEELDLEKLPPYVRAMPTFTPGEGLEQGSQEIDEATQETRNVEEEDSSSSSSSSDSLSVSSMFVCVDHKEGEEDSPGSNIGLQAPFPEEEGLFVDLDEAVASNIFYCPPCAKRFPTVSAFREHLSFRHFKEQIVRLFVRRNSSGVPSCSVCGYTGSSLSRHVGTVHKKVDLFLESNSADGNRPQQGEADVAPKGRAQKQKRPRLAAPGDVVPTPNVFDFEDIYDKGRTENNNRPAVHSKTLGRPKSSSGSTSSSSGSSPAPQECFLCHKFLNSRGGLKSHVVTHFPDQLGHFVSGTRCTLCDFEGKYRYQVVQHLAVDHQKLKGLIGPQRFKELYEDHSYTRSFTSRLVQPPANVVEEEEEAYVDPSSVGEEEEASMEGPSVVMEQNLQPDGMPTFVICPRLVRREDSLQRHQQQFYQQQQQQQQSFLDEEVPFQAGEAAAALPPPPRSPASASAIGSTCFECSKTLHSSSSLKKHIVTHYTQAIARDSNLAGEASGKCPFPQCSYQGKFRCNIIQHLAITHEMLKPYIGQERFHDLYGRQVQKTAAALAVDASAAIQDPLDMELL